ncbi:hypothetical protein GCM10010492_13900 [Saccharothrix mutabilis subsp. mutabilis]|uniref:Uncharacterized protein n=1 Tax=Saccharothrix mutabilis subsp. mutabilis TaxID=66855 RepID=A0ABP3CWP5_9PSEU
MISHASVVPAQRSGDVVPEVEAVSAVERYKEIVALADESVRRMREVDHQRVVEALDRLVASQDRMAEAVEQEMLTRVGVTLLWESALDLLWDERWLTMKPLPNPDESVPPRPQGHYNGMMELAHQRLEDSLQKRTLFRKGS